MLKTIGVTGLGYAGVNTANAATSSTGDSIKFVEAMLNYTLDSASSDAVQRSAVEIDNPKGYWVDSEEKKLVFSQFARSGLPTETHAAEQAVAASNQQLDADFNGHQDMQYVVVDRTLDLRPLRGVLTEKAFTPPQFSAQFTGSTVRFTGPRSVEVPAGKERSRSLSERQMTVKIRPPRGSEEYPKKELKRHTVTPTLTVRNHGSLEIHEEK